MVDVWTNEEQGKSGGKSSAASLYITECTQTEGTVEQEYWHEGTSIGIAVGTGR